MDYFETFVIIIYTILNNYSLAILKDYYKILEINKDSSFDEIKKAFRKLSKQYHPDVNLDPNAEEKFKEIAGAYDILGDPKKREAYDSSRDPRSRFGGKSTFDDWANEFAKSDSGFGRGSTRGGFTNAHTNKTPSSDYLNVNKSVNIELKDLILGTQIEVKYDRFSVDGSFQTTKGEKILNIHLDLRKKYLPITKIGDKHIINIKLDKLGSEGIHRRTNLWGDIEMMVLYGDFTLEVNVIIPDNISIQDNHIIQYIDIPLYKALFPDEKVRISTMLDKSYDAEISTPKKLNDLKFNIKEQGVKGKSTDIGNYIIKFNIIPPDLTKINKSTLKSIKESFMQE